MAAEIQRKRKVTAREGAEKMGLSIRTIQRYIAQPRAEYIQEQKARRLAILETYETGGLTWAEVAQHFGGIHPDTARKLAAKARKERAADAEKNVTETTSSSEANGGLRR